MPCDVSEVNKKSVQRYFPAAIKKGSEKLLSCRVGVANLDTSLFRR